MTDITGTLQNWAKVGQVVYGEIYGDIKGRFPDGTDIRTSRIEKIDGDTLYTLNSIYKLGEPKP